MIVVQTFSKKIKRAIFFIKKDAFLLLLVFFLKMRSTSISFTKFKEWYIYNLFLYINLSLCSLNQWTQLSKKGEQCLSQQALGQPTTDLEQIISQSK